MDAGRTKKAGSVTGGDGRRQTQCAASTVGATGGCRGAGTASNNRTCGVPGSSHRQLSTSLAQANLSAASVGCVSGRASPPTVPRRQCAAAVSVPACHTLPAWPCALSGDATHPHTRECFWPATAVHAPNLALHALARFRTSARSCDQSKPGGEFWNGVKRRGYRVDEHH